MDFDKILGLNQDEVDQVMVSLMTENPQYGIRGKSQHFVEETDPSVVPTLAVLDFDKILGLDQDKVDQVMVSLLTENARYRIAQIQIKMPFFCNYFR